MDDLSFFSTINFFLFKCPSLIESRVNNLLLVWHTTKATKPTKGDEWEC